MPSQALGPEVGLATIGGAVRNPDAMVTCSKLAGNDYAVPGVIVVVEVLSPTSSRLDRITKILEYGAVPSIRHYVIAESTGIGLTALWRADADQAFTARVLTAGQDLALPELGISVPVTEIYEGVAFDEEG